MDEERYEITALIGKGRTGGVYEADDTKLSRKVAIRRFFCAKGDTSIDGWEEQFKSIALNLCHLTDPNIIQVLDAGVDEDGAFLVSQLIDGTRLSDCLAERPLTQDEAYDLATQLLDSLSIAHDAGFVHGAITAGSIHMVERSSGRYRFVLMDLGLARLAPLIQGADSSLALMADLALLAPELFDGEKTSPCSDIYMVGHLIFMSLIGGHPFALHDREAVEQAHKNGELPSLTKYRSDLSPVFVKWISSLTEPDKEKRLQSTAAAIAALPKKSELTASFAASKNAVLTKTPPSPPPKIAPPPALARPPKPPTARQPVTPAPSLAPISKKSGKSKPLVAVCVILCVVAAAGAGWYFTNKNDSPEITETEETPKHLETEDAPKYQEIEDAPKPREVEVIKQAHKPATPFFEIYKTSNPAKHQRKGCEVSDATQLDWVVYRHPSSENIHSNNESNRIGKIKPLGKIVEQAKTVGTLRFYDSAGGKFEPNLFARCNSKAAGWEIPIDISNIDSNTATLKLHFSKRKIKSRVELLTTEGEALFSSDFIENQAFASYGISSDLDLTALQNNQQLLLRLTNLSQSDEKNTGISLNAIMIE